MYECMKRKHEKLNTYTLGMSYKKRFIRNDFETSLNSVKIKKQKLYIREILRNGFPRITSQQGNFKKRVA